MHAFQHTSALGLSIAGLFVSGFLAGCASDVGSEQEVIVGSNVMAEHDTPVSVLTSLRLRLPFKVSLRNCESKKVVLRGEDNLLEQITVDEEAENSWRIMAPLDLHYTQHTEIEIEVPYIDMVEVKYNRENVRFIDRPGSFLRDPVDTP